MKSMVLFIFFIAVLTHTAKCSFFDSVDISIAAQYHYVTAIGENYGFHCPTNQQHKLDEALDTFEKCLKEVDKNVETACTAFTNHFHRCSKPVFGILQTCLPNESKHVPKFLVEVIDELVSHLCREDGHHLFEFFNSCLYKSSEGRKRCESSIPREFEQFKITPLTKKGLCKVAQNAKSCVYDHLEESCGNKITRDSVMRLFDTVVSVCNRENMDHRNPVFKYFKNHSIN